MDKANKLNFFFFFDMFPRFFHYSSLRGGENWETGDVEGRRELQKKVKRENHRAIGLHRSQVWPCSFASFLSSDDLHFPLR